MTAWGSNNYGQTNIPSDLGDVVAIAAGNWHTLALRADGTVAAWGRDWNGITNVPPGLSNVVAIACGDVHSIALKDDGTVVAWGSGSSSTNPPPDLTNAVAIAASEYSSMALRADGTVEPWTDWPPMPPGLSNIAAISAGIYHRTALESNGVLHFWESDFYKFHVSPDGLSNVVAVSSGHGHCLVLQEDGTVTQYGGGATNVPPSAMNPSLIHAGFGQSWAISPEGEPIGWGTVYIGGTSNVYMPAGLNNVVSIAAGETFTAALISDPFAAGSVSFADGVFQFSISGTSGDSIAVECSTNLLDWVTVTNLSTTNGPVTFSTDNAGDNVQNFYRLRED